MDIMLSGHLKLLLEQYGIEAFESHVDRIVSEYRGTMHVVHTRETATWPVLTFALTNSEFDRVMVHVNANEKIAAIKLFRAITGAGLIEAKNAIEGPDFNMETYDQRYGASSRCG